MEAKTFDAHHASLRLSRDELATISQGLNEVCYGLHVVDFAPKMGADRPKVGRLLDQIIAIYYQMKRSRSLHVTVSFSDGELRAIIGALKTVCREISEFEFQTRMGDERSEVEQLLDQIIPVYRKMKQVGSSMPPES